MDLSIIYKKHYITILNKESLYVQAIIVGLFGLFAISFNENVAIILLTAAAVFYGLSNSIDKK